jgi:hypothetical protein
MLTPNDTITTVRWPKAKPDPLAAEEADLLERLGRLQRMRLASCARPDGLRRFQPRRIVRPSDAGWSSW